MSDSFEARREELKKIRDPESRYYTEDEKEREYILTDKDEYKREPVFSDGGLLAEVYETELEALLEEGDPRYNEEE